jgi:hypothetical protein
MPRCAGIKRDGGRCAVVVRAEQTHCYAHDPSRAAERQKNAARGGRAKASTEIRSLKAEIKALIEQVRDGSVDRNDASSMLQGYRALLEFIKLERGVYVEEDLAQRIEELRAREAGREQIS